MRRSGVCGTRSRSATTLRRATARTGDLRAGHSPLQLVRLLYRRQSWCWLELGRQCVGHVWQYVHGIGQTTKFLGGGQVGVNYEFYGGVVIGAEAMFDWLPNTTNTFTATEGPTGPAPGTVASATFNNRWLTTATGKLGYAWDRVLLYGKGGGAWVGANNPNLTVGGFGQTLTSSTTTNFGWTAGIGVEWAFAGNWSARAEYDYIGLQNQTVTVAAVPGAPFAGDTININNRNISMFTAGLNYKFGGWGY